MKSSSSAAVSLFIQRRSMLLLALVLLTLPPAVSGQSTVQFGFEEFKLGASPPFVTQVYPQINPEVADPTSFPNNPQPFEGAQYLRSVGWTLLQSPDGKSIQSYTVHVFLPVKPNSTSFRFGVESQSIDQAGSWQTVQGSFNLPAQSVTFSAADLAQQSYYEFFIDDVQLVTIPEPQTFWLVTIGLTAIASRAFLKRPKPARA